MICIQSINPAHYPQCSGIWKDITLAYTHLHKHHAEVDFLLQFVLADYAGLFEWQMSKESLVILSNVLFHAFTKLKQYEQLPGNYNSSFKIYCGFDE